MAAQRLSNTRHDELSWRRKLAFSGTAIVLFLIVLAALGEIAVRLATPKSDPVKLGAKLDGSARLYGLRPNHRSLKTGVVVQTNSLGFREKEYPVERQPGVRRIVVLGDSYTFGVGVQFPEIFSKRLEAGLNRSGQRFEAINFGVPGYNTTLELATLREVAARFKPDLVIVGYVLNDTEHLGPEGDAAGQPLTAQSFLNRVHLAIKDLSMLYRFAAPRLGDLAALFNSRYAVGATNEIIRSFEDDAPGWRESRQALLGIVDEARKLGAPTLVVVFPMMVHFSSYPLKSAHARITRFCEAHGIPVLDLLPSLAQRKASELVVVLDGHPNGRAHEIFARAIQEYLARNDPSHAHGPQAAYAR